VVMWGGRWFEIPTRDLSFTARIPQRHTGLRPCSHQSATHHSPRYNLPTLNLFARSLAGSIEC